MTIQGEMGNGILTVKPEGKLDTVSSPELEAYLKERYDGCRQIVIDLEKVDYISSAGLRVLVQAHKVMKDREGLVLRHVCGRVMEVLEMTGYVHVLRIEENTEEM